MWWGRIVQTVVKVAFLLVAALAAGLLFSAGLYVYFQAIGLIAK